MSPFDLHPDAEPIAFLLGTWSGRGVGIYPTIDDFEYEETATFTHVGKPFIAYAQKTKRAGTDEPLHSESGYLRPTGNDSVELVIAQPSGIVEMHEGVIAGQSITFTSIKVLTTPTAKEVSTVQRALEVEGEVLRYSMLMGAVGQRHQLHLRADLNLAKPNT